MKRSQKLKVEIAGMVFVIKYADIPYKIKHIADALEYREFNMFASGYIKDGVEQVFVKVDYFLKDGERRPKPKLDEKMIFGYDSAELLAKQYK